MSNGKLFVGMVLGVLAGNALNRFGRTEKGRKLKNDLCDILHGWQEDAMDYAHRAKYKAESVGNKVTGKVGQAMGDMNCKLNEMGNK